MEFQHWRHWQHPLVFNEDERSGVLCWGCFEPVFGPSYSCKECRGESVHHKSCAELPIGLHHPSHPNHPLIIFHMFTYNDEEYENFSKCDVCGEKSSEYSYCCYRCNFNIHIRCSSLSLTIQTEVHDHQLTHIWKLLKFTCDFCGKEGNLPYLCAQCDFGIHARCAACPRKLKVDRHSHPLHLTPSLEVHQSDSPICLLCVRKVDTLCLYYCSRCNFAAHLYCAMLPSNREYINLQELKEEQSLDPELHQSFDSEICKVKKTTVREDGTEIATEIKHFSHEHDLKLTDKIPNNTKCDGCVQAILPPFYSYFKCAALPQTTWYNQHEHPFTLRYTLEDDSDEYYCEICEEERDPKQWFYYCEDCNFPAHCDSRQLEYLAGKISDGPNSQLEDALGIAQHHDAITSNAEQHTRNDYTKRGAFGASEVEAIVNATL
uniref:Phorbol-ester/DAG-type domain-containing protein n=1 Tax=Quercus lobata TaxID=97700 RepID=A0A7N2R0L8_QUELO